MTVAAVAPAAPGIAWGLLVLASALAFGVSYALLHSWNQTFGRAFSWLGGLALKIPIPHFSDISLHPFGFLLKIDNTIKTYLGQAVAATENAMVYSFHKLTGTILWTAQETKNLALDVYHALASVEHTATTRATKVIRQTVVKPITRTVTIVKTNATALEHKIAAEVAKAEATIKHLTKVAAHAVAQPIPRLGRLERDVANEAKSLRKMKYLAAYASLAALGLAILKRLGLSWLRCSNVNKTGKALCGMNANLLEALLLDAAALTIAFNLETFAEEMQTVTEEAARLIHDFAG